MSEKKLLLGPKVRRLRKDQRLTQAQMAADLDISPAYLNLIEHNQRPVSAQVLVKITAAYDIDLPSFARDDTPEIAARFREAFSRPAFRRMGLTASDFEDLANLSPEAIEAFLELAESAQSSNRSTPHAEEAHQQTPGHEVQAFFDRAGSYLADLEDQATALRTQMGLREVHLAEEIDGPLRGLCLFEIQILPARIMGQTLRRFDMHRRRLLLNRMLPAGSKRFQTLMQYALNQASGLLDQQIEGQSWEFEQARTVARIQLAAYLSAAVLMPYDTFLEAAQNTGYDVEALALEFDVTREQVAHRLTSLRRPGAQGLTCFMARYDTSGRQTKAVGFDRFSGDLQASDVLREAAMHVLHAPQIHCSTGQASNEEPINLVAFSRQKQSLNFETPGPLSAIVFGYMPSETQLTVYSTWGAKDHLQSQLSWRMTPRAPQIDFGSLDEHRRDMRPFDFL